MPFPTTRMRRMRRTEGRRRLVRETSLAPHHLMLPLFFEDADAATPIDGIPGHSRWTIDDAPRIAHEAAAAGLAGVLLFGVPARKDAEGSAAWDVDGVVQRVTRAMRSAAPELVIAADTCMCQYTDHGHCGIVSGDTVDNDATLELLARTAVSQADAGADVIAPSDMMDGRVSAIRTALDTAGHTDVAIMSYSTKYASALYGPFRGAAGSAPGTGDRRGYQMDPANSREGVREAELDVDEGADLVMVKPAMAYLDVIARVRDAVPVPLAAYHVSGEYAMLHAASDRGWLDYDAALLESVTAIRRAGADTVITYGALEVARMLDTSSAGAATAQPALATTGVSS